ncbi:hypothetical protein QOZ80_7AG0578270 [Eleusine coracana subsp. coracana]|nr:hypothetical protein QOZ80_7AG0578270 [Eleusine coracana subsp. coracana]
MAGTGRRKKAGGRTHDGVDAAARPAVSCMAIATVAVVALLLAASVLLFLVPPPQTAPATSGAGGPRREPVELAMGVAGHEGWLDALRAWAKLACLRLIRPAAGEPWSPAASVKVAAAAKKSLEMGKEAVEHTAESAARATEEAVERTAETVRRKVSARSPSARRRHADL